MPTKLITQPTSPRYQTIYEIIKTAITKNHLNYGTVLLEAPLAKLFNTSRVPVRQALQLLCEKQLITRFEGRGYLVNPNQQQIPPLRVSITREMLGTDQHRLLDTRLLSEKIYDQLHMTISNIILYGHYRLDEHIIADFFNVSRSVVREALKSLHIQGLIEKEPYGEWLAGPLTAKSVNENYEIRSVLEPVALKKNIVKLSVAELTEMSSRITQVQHHPDQINFQLIQQIEKDLHQTICNVFTFNEKMGNILIHAQSSILISQLLHQAIHVNDYHLMLNEHAQVFEALFYGSVNDAAQALEKHIQSAQKRSVDYLKVFSIIPEPHIAPYLERLT